MQRLLVMVLMACAASARSSSLLLVAENETARDIATELVEPFTNAKVKVKVAGPQAPATQCLMKPLGERPRCLAQAGETAFVDAVLQLGATVAKGRTAVTFSLLSLDDGKLLKRETASGARSKLTSALKPVVTRLAKAFKPRAGANSSKETQSPKPEPAAAMVVRPESKPLPPAPAPEEPRLTPLDSVVVEPTSSATSAVATSTRGTKTGAWVATGLAGAAAGLSGVFAAWAMGIRANLDRNEGGVSALTRSQANALADQANTQLTVALIAAVTAGAVAVVAALLWSQTP
jgi:hypothetical protein